MTAMEVVVVAELDEEGPIAHAMTMAMEAVDWVAMTNQTMV